MTMPSINYWDEQRPALYAEMLEALKEVVTELGGKGEHQVLVLRVEAIIEKCEKQS